MSVELMGVTNLDDFLELDKESMADFVTTGAKENGDIVTIRLAALDIKKILRVQAWFVHHEDPTDATWANLTLADFNKWKTASQATDIRASLNVQDNSTAPPTTLGNNDASTLSSQIQINSPTNVPFTSASNNFQRGIKINIADYTKFKDDKQWYKWTEQIASIASLHQTSNVLNSDYVPNTQEEIELFGSHNRFMYTVFTECVQTSKGKICIRAHSKSMDGQATYKDLTKAYTDSISVSLVSASLRADLVTNRLDNSYKKSSESFLMGWSHKIMDLESIENSMVPDKDKRIWLTTALSGHKELSSAIRNATVVEMTTKATSGGTAVDMPWESFFDLIMANARMTDVENQKTAKRQQAAHQATTTPGRGGAGRGRGGRGGRDGRGRGGRGRGGGRPPPNTKNEGPNQVMKAGMQFSSEDWWGLTEAQRDTMTAFRKATPNPTTTPTTIAVNATVVEEASGDGSSKMVNDIRTILSNSHSRKINVMKINYKVNLSHATTNCGSLIDGGANGGMSGADVRLLETGYDTADVSGIADNSVQNLPIATCAGLVESTTGPIIVIMHQYAHYGKGKTIHSVNQLLQFGVEVDATPRKFGGKQRIRTSSGHFVPLHIRNGLAYMDMTPPTDHDMDTYPTVFLTSDEPWDPTSIDNDYAMEDVEADDTDTIPDYRTETVNDYGELLNRSSAECVMTNVNTHETKFCDYVDDCLYAVHCTKYSTNGTHKNSTNVERKELDFNRLKPNFAWMPVERIKRTLENTTQYARADNRIPMRQHYKSRFPACNVKRWNETVATDTFFSDIPAHDDGIKSHGGTTMVQLYTGVDSLLTDVFPMKLASDMVGTFEDLIRKRGAPNELASDNAKEQTCKAVDEVLRMYSIGDFQSEPHQQHQNFAERRIQEVKKLSDGIMDKTGTPAKMWLLCLMYVVYLQNHLATESIGWKTPLEAATGQKADVSALLQFRWWEPVYYLADARTYPTESREKLGRWVGVAENQGDALTYQVLDDISGKVIVRSNVRSALNDEHPNLRAETPAGSTPDYGEVNPTSKPILLSASDIPEDGELPRWVNRSDLKLPKFKPEELMGLTFIRETADGQKVRAKIVRQIVTQEDSAHENLKFLIELGEAQFDELIGYHELCEIVEQQHEAEADGTASYAFKAIIGHQGPLNQNHHEYNGSRWNVLVQWEDGTETYEPLDIFRKDDPATLAQYALDNDLLDTEGWKSLRRLAKNKKKLQRMVKQAKSSASHNHGPTWSFGVQVPRNDREADQLDIKNGNTKWADARKAELDQLAEYSTFKDIGLGDLKPAGYKKINVRMIYAVKHDLRHKARLVAGGHLTDPSLDSNYSGVVSLRSLRILITVAELNGMTTKVADVGNAYLEAYTREKVYVVFGEGFGELSGHTLIIEKALYGLRSSGARFHEKFADTLRDMGYTPCKADPDVWLKDCGTHYEYVCVYVDDLMVMGKNPDDFFKGLTDDYGYKLKGVGDPAFHLGGNFFRDSDGTLAWGAESYIKKMLVNYEIMFGCKPKEWGSPVEKGDHPELDVSEFLDVHGIRQYQSLIGALQWAITLGRFELLIGVTTMSTYRVAPRIGHMNRLKRMYGFLKRRPDGAIRFRTGIPNHEATKKPVEYDWSQTVYGPNLHEELPADMPEPKGHPVRISTYEDANLMHDLISGRSMTGILHLLNQTPIYWFSKKQGSVETATYGSEFVAAKTATEQIMDLKYTLRMMGIPLDGPAWMFGDNQSVLTSATVPQSNLNKRHNALAYHRVREAVSAKVMYFMHIPGKVNVSDIFTKFLPWVRPVLVFSKSAVFLT